MFSSLQDIRSEAGVTRYERQVGVTDVDRGEPMAGDGSTTVFYTEYTPIVDRTNDEDGDVTIADVIVYVDGVVVTVSAVDADQGKITLDSAPALDASIKISYDSSDFLDAQVSGVRLSAYAKIMTSISKIYVMPVESTAVNADFVGSVAEDYLELAETLLAAGKLMKVAFPDVESSIYEQGKAKMKEGESMLSDIQKGKVILIDTSFNELSDKGTFGPTGFPMTDDTSSSVEDTGYAFPVNQQL